MKKIFLILVAASALLWTACTSVDLSPIEKRLAELETAVQTLQQVSQTGDYITDVQPLKEGDEIVGYIVTFKEHGTFTVRHGKNGKDGNDGSNGQQGPQGPEGPAGPQGPAGPTGAAGENGETWFADVQVTDDTVTFILDDDDNTTFVIPRAGAAADFGLIIENRNITVSKGAQVIEVPYSIKGGDAETVISVLESAGYTVEVQAEKLILTAPAEPVAAQIWVVAENGAGKSSVVVLRISVGEAGTRTLAKSEWSCTPAAVIDGDVTTYGEGAELVVDLAADRMFDTIMLAQAADLTGATLASKFALAISDDGQTWNDVLTDQVLVGRVGGQTFALAKEVTARYIKVTLSEPFEADLPIRLAEIDLSNTEESTGTPAPLAEVPALRNAVPPFETDGVGHFSPMGDRFQYHNWWYCTQSTFGITFDTGANMPGYWAAAIWGCSDMDNAKSYQFQDFQPGYYAFEPVVYGADDPYDIDVFIFASAGNGGDNAVELPDINAENGEIIVKEKTLAYQKVDEINGHDTPVPVSLMFKVATAGTYTVGSVCRTYSGTHVGQDEGGNWIHVWAAFYFTQFGLSGK